MYFNKNPFNDRMSHIPHTHYDSTRLDTFGILFMYGSIESKLKSFNIPVSDVFGAIYKSWTTSRDPNSNSKIAKYVSDTDLEAILILNEVMSSMFTGGINSLSYGNANYNGLSQGIYIGGATSEDVSSNLHNSLNLDYDTLKSLVSKYDHKSDTYLQSSKANVDNFNLVDDPTSDTLNIIDTGVPTDLYYRMSIIDGQYLKVTLYQNFFDYILNNDKHHIYEFVKNLLIKSNEQLTLDELARTQLFRNYINILGTSQI